VITRVEFIRLLQKIEMKSEEKELAFFRQIPYMSKMNSRVLKNMYQKTILTSYKKNSCVFRQGGPVDYICIVKKG